MSETARREMQPLYGYSHAMLAIAYSSFFRGDVAGLEHLPKTGGYMLASNHASHLDPPFVGIHLPNQVSFFARKTLWHSRIASWWLDGVGTIPVDRDGGTDVKAIKRVLNALEQERVVILFPEGTRSVDGKLQKPRPGIGLLASYAKLPIVPARIFGSFEAFGKSGKLRLGTPISVTYGRPIQPSEYLNAADPKSERFGRIAERVMSAIAALEPPRRPVI
jgi:1-acyl-sn-glycerol-3-phosphate acyltransferase